MTPLPCPRCLDDVVERARVHIDYHRAGLAQGQLTDGVKQIANSDNGGKKCY